MLMRRRRPNLSTITLIEMENIECNEEENARVKECMNPMKFKPQPGYGAMLQLGGEWVTIHF